MLQVLTQLRIAGYTDTGIRREYNQDHIAFDQGLGIAVLADGMGGHKAGEIAAQMTVKFVLEKMQKLVLQETSVSITGSQLLEVVSNTISSSNAELFRAQGEKEAYKGMGTTIVVTLVVGSHIYVGHVGDSRLYLYRNRTLKRLTKDHSLVQDLIDRGFYTEREARKANVRHVVTRSMGTKSDVDIDTAEIPLLPYDLLMLCSDGLTDMVSDWQIAETIHENIADLDLAAKELITLANQNGGKDNISVILIQT